MEPRLILEKHVIDGKAVIRMTVKNATPELGALLSSLGMIPGVVRQTDIAARWNDYTNTYTTPQALDAARNPIKSMFGHSGEWLGMGSK